MDQKKKEYQPLEIRVLRFETEDVLKPSDSGFMGGDDDLTTTMYRINSNTEQSNENQVNPT